MLNYPFSQKSKFFYQFFNFTNTNKYIIWRILVYQDNTFKFDISCHKMDQWCLYLILKIYCRVEHKFKRLVWAILIKLEQILASGIQRKSRIKFCKVQRAPSPNPRHSHSEPESGNTAGSGTEGLIASWRDAFQMIGCINMAIWGWDVA